MYAKINNIKSLSRTFYKRFFFLAKILASTTVLLSQGINVAQSAPQSLPTDVKVRNITNTLSTSPSIWIVKDLRNNILYHLKLNGEIYQVNLVTGASTLVYNKSDHNLTNTPGMAIGPNGTIYLVNLN